MRLCGRRGAEGGVDDQDRVVELVGYKVAVISTTPKSAEWG
jgi:hypothetical protein